LGAIIWVFIWFCVEVHGDRDRGRGRCGDRYRDRDGKLKIEIENRNRNMPLWIYFGSNYLVVYLIMCRSRWR
jgi:hypothetical protein